VSGSVEERHANKGGRIAHPLNTSESLRRLSDADYEVAAGEYDVRGWDVMATNDEKIGTVVDLIIDPAAGKVRYLEVNVDRKAVGIDRDRHVLIPIGNAQLDTGDKQVLLSGMTRPTLANVPATRARTSIMATTTPIGDTSATHTRPSG
jgi:PRC-barrel domain